MDESIRIQQKGGELHVVTKVPRMTYLNNIMRANCFPELHDLFKHAHSPAKEFTESYSAFQNLRGWLRQDTEWQVLHIGDGAHARTAALFAFLAPNTHNMAIDPNANLYRVHGWRERFQVKRFYVAACTAESIVHLAANKPTLVTFVHAHVDTDAVLDALPRWDAAFTMACCQPGKQLSTRQRVIREAQDWHVLSEQRTYQVLTPAHERIEAAA